MYALHAIEKLNVDYSSDKYFVLYVKSAITSTTKCSNADLIRSYEDY